MRRRRNVTMFDFTLYGFDCDSCITKPMCTMNKWDCAIYLEAYRLTQSLDDLKEKYGRWIIKTALENSIFVKLSGRVA